MSSEIQKELVKTRREIKKESKSLKRKQQIAEDQNKYRQNKKPLLHKTFLEIAMFGSGADERRRTNLVRSVKTLSDLHEELKKEGFNLSRSATYLRLLPRSSSSIEGKSHVRTVPVKLCRAQADYHKQHIDGYFATASIKYLENVASVLGPAQVFFLSQDDKARVPIGLAAANKQAPLLMHLEYKVKLPDHDWVGAPRHKLIPSVYAGVIISPQKMGDPKAVGYSGPTFISIRSGKHSSSTAGTHARDFDSIVKLESFKSLARTEEGLVKPVVTLTSDGGPDENPRYGKVISHAVQHFKAYNLDAIFVATNAPGRSVFNRVERRMAPLSRELSGLILPHDMFESHLDNQGRTTDFDLEEKNFEFAGRTLAKVWGNFL
nr:uncharacterized protein LOC122321057 [Drosophila bipectinata]XP_043066049.1 uncharacterized protein LOC122321057 [Drosophila bipectinata]